MMPVIVLGAFILAVLIVGLILDRTRDRPLPKRRQPTDPNEGFLQGYVLGSLLNPPGDGPQPGHHSGPPSADPAPHQEIHHTFPDHSPSIDTSSHSHDSGSFDGGSSHSGH